MNPGEIEPRLEQALDRLGELLAEQRHLASAAATAKVGWEVENAKAMLRARDRGMSVESAKADALIATSELYQQWLIADSELRSNRQALQVLETQVDILRTLAVSHRGVF